MNRIKTAVNRVDIRKFRFWLQLGSFALLVYGGFFAIDLGRELPVFNCGYNRDGAGMCYFLPLQHQLARPWPRLFSLASLSVLSAFGLFLLWFIVLNKAWCGYICPLGTLQDWITALRKRMRIRYSTYSATQFQHLSKIKYVLLLLMLLIPIGIGGDMVGAEWRGAFCKICPGRMIMPLFTGDVSQWTIDFSSTTTMILTALGMVITGLFFIGAFFKKRFFCLFCPMSAMHYIFSKFAFIKLVKDGDKCTRCGDCYRVCDMEIRPIADDVESRDILKDDCILCLKCVAACPEEGCLKVNLLGKTLFEATEHGFAKRMNTELSEKTEQ